METCSKALSMISVDVLCSLLKFVIQRMKYPDVKNISLQLHSFSVGCCMEIGFVSAGLARLETSRMQLLCFCAVSRVNCFLCVSVRCLE